MYGQPPFRTHLCEIIVGAAGLIADARTTRPALQSANYLQVGLLTASSRHFIGEAGASIE